MMADLMIALLDGAKAGMKDSPSAAETAVWMVERTVAWKGIS